MHIPIPFKRGDTFVLFIEASQDGNPVDLTGWTFRCHVRLGVKLIETLKVELIAPGSNQLKISSPGSTARWPVAKLSSDIEFTNPSGVIISSETFLIDCIQDETF